MKTKFQRYAFILVLFCCIVSITCVFFAYYISGNTNHLYKISLPLLTILIVLITRRAAKTNSN